MHSPGPRLGYTAFRYMRHVTRVAYYVTRISKYSTPNTCIAGRLYNLGLLQPMSVIDFDMRGGVGISFYLEFEQISGFIPDLEAEFTFWISDCNHWRRISLAIYEFWKSYEIYRFHKISSLWSFKGELEFLFWPISGLGAIYYAYLVQEII